MKIIVYALMAVLLVTLFAILLIITRGLIKIACLIALIFVAAVILHEINK
jgi:hypothetical protein